MTLSKPVCPWKYAGLSCEYKVTFRTKRNVALFVHTLCNQLVHGHLKPANREHFPVVAADPGAGAGPGRPSEPAALGLGHPGKLLHPCAFFVTRYDPSLVAQISLVVSSIYWSEVGSPPACSASASSGGATCGRVIHWGQFIDILWGGTIALNGTISGDKNRAKN